MNKKIYDKMPKEVQVLWELSKQRNLDSKFRKIVSDSVKSFKDEYSSRETDPLEVKASEFKKEGAWANDKILELSKKIYDDKCPENIDLGKWISVEIECILPHKFAEGEFVKFVRKNGYGKFVTIKNDGSIHPDSFKCRCAASESDNDIDCVCEYRKAFGREVVVSFKDGQWDMIKNICKKLTEVGATVNKTCGLHVHFDCRHLSARSAQTLGNRIVPCIPVLKQLLPKSRQENQFCSIDINNLRGSDERSRQRYAFVNMLAYNKHKTIEIRGHSGTLDGIKIVNWIKILRTIMGKRNKKVFATVSEMVDFYKFNAGMTEYIISRYTKFNKVDLNADDVAADDESRIEEDVHTAEHLPASSLPRNLFGDTVSSLLASYPFFERSSVPAGVTIEEVREEVRQEINTFWDENGMETG